LISSKSSMFSYYTNELTVSITISDDKISDFKVRGQMPLPSPIGCLRFIALRAARCHHRVRCIAWSQLHSHRRSVCSDRRQHNSIKTRPAAWGWPENLGPNRMLLCLRSQTNRLHGYHTIRILLWLIGVWS